MSTFGEYGDSDEILHIFLNNIDSFNGKYILSAIHNRALNLSKSKHFSEYKNIDVLKNENSKDLSNAAQLIPKKSFTIEDILEGTPKKRNTQKSDYKVYGSLSKPNIQESEEITEIVSETNEKFKCIIKKSKFVIYDISLDNSQIAKARTALSYIEQDIEAQTGMAQSEILCLKTFILITPVMTWASTPKLIPGDTSCVPFFESDYGRRKPHPNYKEHIEFEKELLYKRKKFKDRLQAIIVCSGVTYGYEENILSFLFKRAWANEPFLPIFGSGSNYIPLIHVADLAKIICTLFDLAKSSVHYILAVEQTPVTLRDIVKYISRGLGSGKVQHVVTEEAFLYSDVNSFIYDHLSVNIILEPEYILNTLMIPWKCEMNLVENIEEIVEEFIQYNNLSPLRILVHGPPCSGKTKLAHLLSEYYNINHINMKSILHMIESNLPTSYASVTFESKSSEISNGKFQTNLKEKFETTKNILTSLAKELLDEEGLLDYDEEDSEDDNYHKNVTEEIIRLIPKDFLDNPYMRFTDDQLVTLFRTQICDNFSRNKGYILDGFPKNLKQAIQLFQNESNVSTFDPHTSQNAGLPQFVIVLNAEDDFLYDRISRAPESLVQNSHYSERDVVRRLISYRERNASHATNVLTFFQDGDTTVIEIDVSEFPSEDMGCIFFICTNIIGPPLGFGLTPQELEQLDIVKESQKKLRREKENLEAQLDQEKNRMALDERMKNILKKHHHENIRDERILSLQLQKHRIFVASKILPILSYALMNVVKVKPDDPVDYLAQNLFKSNSAGRMYNPRYSRNGEVLLNNNRPVITEKN